jgi:hypothetical protein
METGVTGVADLSLIASAHAVSDGGQGILDPALAAIIAGIVVALVTLAWKSRSEGKKTRKVAQEAKMAADAAHDADIEQLVLEMHQALVTQPPTALVPEQPLGLVDVVKAMRTAQVDIVRRMDGMETDLSEMKTTLTQNGGRENTVVDRLARIEDAVTPEDVHPPAPGEPDLTSH